MNQRFTNLRRSGAYCSAKIKGPSKPSKPPKPFEPSKCDLDSGACDAQHTRNGRLQGSAVPARGGCFETPFPCLAPHPIKPNQTTPRRRASTLPSPNATPLKRRRVTATHESNRIESKRSDPRRPPPEQTKATNNHPHQSVPLPPAPPPRPEALYNTPTVFRPSYSGDSRRTRHVEESITAGGRGIMDLAPGDSHEAQACHESCLSHPVSPRLGLMPETKRRTRNAGTPPLAPSFPPTGRGLHRPPPPT